jgi:hypothetical protein
LDCVLCFMAVYPGAGISILTSRSADNVHPINFYRQYGPSMQWGWRCKLHSERSANLFCRSAAFPVQTPEIAGTEAWPRVANREAREEPRTPKPGATLARANWVILKKGRYPRVDFSGSRSRAVQIRNWRLQFDGLSLFVRCHIPRVVSQFDVEAALRRHMAT